MKLILVPGGGVEPPRPCDRRILSRCVCQFRHPGFATHSPKGPCSLSPHRMRQLLNVRQSSIAQPYVDLQLLPGPSNRKFSLQRQAHIAAAKRHLCLPTQKSPYISFGTIFPVPGTQNPIVRARIAWRPSASGFTITARACPTTTSDSPRLTNQFLGRDFVRNIFER